MMTPVLKNTIIGNLVLASVASVAFAQFRPPRPNEPHRESRLEAREDLRIVSVRQQVKGRDQVVDITREVMGFSQNQIISSLTVFAASAAGKGSMEVVIDGRRNGPVKSFEVKEKRTAIQVDIDLDTYERRFRSIQLVTDGNIYIDSLVIASSDTYLPRLDDRTGPNPPPRNGPKCNILTAGVANNQYFNHRVAIDDRVVDGADSFAAAIEKARKLESSGLCVLDGRDEACSLAPSGVVNNRHYNLLVTKKGAPLVGADSLNEALGHIRLMEQQRVCRPAREACELMGSGVASNSYYAHRIGIAGQPVLGSDSLDGALRILSDLRNANICQ